MWEEGSERDETTLDTTTTGMKGTLKKNPGDEVDFNWKERMSRCGLWNCPFEGSIHPDNQKECMICGNNVPDRALLRCETWKHSACVLCLIRVYANRQVQGNAFRCCFCRREFKNLATQQLLLFYYGHKNKLPVEVTTKHQPGNQEYHLEQALHHLELALGLEPEVAGIRTSSPTGDPEWQTLYDVETSVSFGPEEDAPTARHGEQHSNQSVLEQLSGRSTSSPTGDSEWQTSYYVLHDLEQALRLEPEQLSGTRTSSPTGDPEWQTLYDVETSVSFGPEEDAPTTRHGEQHSNQSVYLFIDQTQLYTAIQEGANIQHTSLAGHSPEAHMDLEQIGNMDTRKEMSITQDPEGQTMYNVHNPMFNDSHTRRGMFHYEQPVQVYPVQVMDPIVASAVPQSSKTTITPLATPTSTRESEFHPIRDVVLDSLDRENVGEPVEEGEIFGECASESVWLMPGSVSSISQFCMDSRKTCEQRESGEANEVWNVEGNEEYFVWRHLELSKSQYCLNGN